MRNSSVQQHFPTLPRLKDQHTPLGSTFVQPGASELSFHWGHEMSMHGNESIKLDEFGVAMKSERSEKDFFDDFSLFGFPKDSPRSNFATFEDFEVPSLPTNTNKTKQPSLDMGGIDSPPPQKLFDFRDLLVPDLSEDTPEDVFDFKVPNAEPSTKSQQGPPDLVIMPSRNAPAPVASSFPPSVLESSLLEEKRELEQRSRAIDIQLRSLRHAPPTQHHNRETEFSAVSPLVLTPSAAPFWAPPAVFANHPVQQQPVWYQHHQQTHVHGAMAIPLSHYQQSQQRSSAPMPAPALVGFQQIRPTATMTHQHQHQHHYSHVQQQQQGMVAQTHQTNARSTKVELQSLPSAHELVLDTHQPPAKRARLAAPAPIAHKHATSAAAVKVKRESTFWQEDEEEEDHHGWSSGDEAGGCDTDEPEWTLNSRSGGGQQSSRGGHTAALQQRAPSTGSVLDPSYEIPRYTRAERAMALNRYREKRARRTYSKKIRYACRKKLADTRPRYKGRFAKVPEFQ